jgi:hypothetical protein
VITNSEIYKPPISAQSQHAKALADAKHHQNIVGWDVVLRGYLSTYWGKYQNSQTVDTNNKQQTRWGITVITTLLNLHKEI